MTGRPATRLLQSAQVCSLTSFSEILSKWAFTLFSPNPYNKGTFYFVSSIIFSTNFPLFHCQHTPAYIFARRTTLVTKWMDPSLTDNKKVSLCKKQEERVKVYYYRSATGKEEKRHRRNDVTLPALDTMRKPLIIFIPMELYSRGGGPGGEVASSNCSGSSSSSSTYTSTSNQVATSRLLKTESSFFVQ